MSIPYKFNPMGISGSSFDLNKGLLFHAPLQENFDAIGGTLYNNPANYGWNFTSDYNGKPCVLGSNPKQGIQYVMDNPISGYRAYTMSIEFFSTTFSYDNRSVFYIGTNILNQVFGFEFEPAGTLGTAWGDKYTYENVTKPTWVEYANQWTAFTATYDMQRIKLYFNGELKFTSDPVTITITKNGGYTNGAYVKMVDLFIGSRWLDGRYWKEGLRNQYIYDYALSEQQVKQFYNATK